MFQRNLSSIDQGSFDKVIMRNINTALRSGIFLAARKIKVVFAQKKKKKDKGGLCIITDLLIKNKCLLSMVIETS